MGVMQQKRLTKPRPAAAAAAVAEATRGPTAAPQADCAAAGTGTATRVSVSISAATRKPAVDKHHAPAVVCSPVRSSYNGIQGLDSVTGATTPKDKNAVDEKKVILPPSDKEANGHSAPKDKNAVDEKKVTLPPSDKEANGHSATDTVKPEDDDLELRLNNMSLDDNDLTRQLKELKIKEKEKDEEHVEDSGLLSRGPERTERTASKGIRPMPYVVEQHIVSSDKHGGATVLYPNISQQSKFESCQYVPLQETMPSYWQSFRRETGRLPYNNSQNVLQDNAKEALDNDLQNILRGASELHQLTVEDLKILEDCTNNILNCYEEHQTNTIQQNGIGVQHFRQPEPDETSSDSFVFDIDEIIESDKYDKSIQHIKQELSKEGSDKQLAPTTPDSAYESDESAIGSPASTVSLVLQTETEKVQPLSSPYSSVITQYNNFSPQTGFPAAPVSPIIQTVQPGMVLVLPQSVMPPTTSPSLIPPSTPPLPSLVPRPILPGVNIPPPCSEPAITRIISIMTEQVKDKVWALIFAKPDTEFTTEDEDGNRALNSMLSNRQKYKNFMEVFHVIIQRLKRIIGKNKDNARKLLAAPNRHGHTPLDVACRYLQSGDQDALAVRYLADTMVEEGLEIGEELDSNGNTLLHKICAYGDKAQFIMSELLSMKDKTGNSVFDVNKENNERKTPLHVAALNHSEQTPCTVLAQLLMRSGALASKKEGCSGNTVFHCVARESCDPNLLVTLLAKTKDVETVVNEKNFNGDTPLHMVAANPTITLDRQRLAVQHLIHYGAQPKLPNKSGKVPLSLVAVDRKQDIKTVLYHK